MEKNEIENYSIIYNTIKEEYKNEIINVFIPFTQKEFYSFCGLFNGSGVKCFIEPDENVKEFFFFNKEGEGFLQIPFTLNQINYIITYLSEKGDSFYDTFYKKFCEAKEKLLKAQ